MVINNLLFATLVSYLHSEFNVRVKSESKLERISILRSPAKTIYNRSPSVELIYGKLYTRLRSAFIS